MYASYFGLKQDPFSIAPDPRFLFMSERHREALAHLLYGLRGGGGFVLLTGEIGAGKTTVCRCFLEQIPKRCNVAYIFNPKLTVEELLKSVCDEFRVPYERVGSMPPSAKDYVDALNNFLLRTHAVGQNNVLIIDEAQNLSADVLEQLRLLTNLETNERKLLQIVLIGQPELRDMLARPDLEQLAQRVIARYHLQALSEVETEQYISHRLGIAGLRRALPFDRRAMRRIHRLSRGVPRRINLLCDRALLGAYAGGKPSVERGTVERAAEEVFGSSRGLLLPSTSKFLRRPVAWGLGLVAGAALFGAVALAIDAQRSKSLPTKASGAVVSGAGAPLARAAASEAPKSTSAAGASAASASAAEGELAWESLIPDELQAWRALASRWGLPLADGDPCQIVRQHEVECFRGDGVSLATIRQLDRPGVMVLYANATSRPAYALLTGLSSDTAILETAAGQRVVSLSALAGIWRGDFATYWRTPPGYTQRPADGSPGPLTDWLNMHLTPANKALANKPLRARVAAFQLAEGLKPDGLAGPVTLMHLNRAAGVDEPRLRH